MNNPVIEKTVKIERFSFDVRCFRDSDLSQFWYDDFINNVGGDCPVLRLKGDFYIVGDYEKPFYKKSELTKMKKAKLLALAEDFTVYDFSEYTKADIVNELLGFTFGDYFKHNVENNRWYDRDYTFIARGYSQGDAVQVALLPDAPKWITREYIENLIYNAPISCRVVITDNTTNKEYDFYLEEYLSDVYEYKEVELLDGLRKEAVLVFPEFVELIVKSVSDLLPNHPDYR